MYGAYWCTHCYDQKQVLGYEVTDKYLEYIECDKKGNPSPDAPRRPTSSLELLLCRSGENGCGENRRHGKLLALQTLNFRAETWQQR
jgi:hypothetical protein